MTDPHELIAGFAERVTALAEQVLGPEFPDAPEEQIEHLLDQMVVWLGWEVFHADPARPAFHRHNDLLSQWGGPNADNVYRHARIAPELRYRITGRMHACDQFILAIRKGFMHNEVWGTVAQVTASDLGIGPGDHFTLTLGGPEPFDDRATAHIELPDGAVMASFREYYYEWTAEEPATMVIECLDEAGSTPPIDAATLEERLDRVHLQMSDSLLYWTRYMNENRDQREPNRFAGGLKVAKGLAVARYSFNFWDLQPDEALIIDFSVPDAAYWALQLYRMGTFELVDPHGRITSRNHTQTTVDDSGRVQVVLSPVDVGVPNHLDTGGRRHGLCTLRWFWPTSDADPAPDARVVPIDRLADEARGAGTVSAADRAAELASRRRHLGWRFRA